jgi:hypothetical protein
MPHSEFTSSTPVIERSLCPKCATQMDLARLASDKPGFDRRTFECSKCGHTETTVARCNIAGMAAYRHDMNPVPVNTPTLVCLSCGDTMKCHTIPKLGKLPELLVFVCPSCKEVEVKEDKHAA